ncbi:MAG: Nif3-like dinuclear metal center hexameric protein [Planctomycetota bacterium]
MLLRDLVEAMETIAPLEAAEPWDRCGLQAGDPDREVEGPVLLTIDLTEQVLVEARAIGAGAIIAYHPPIWEALTTLSNATPGERIIRTAVEHKIAIYSPHTALDAARDGLTDWICEGLSAPVGSVRAGEIAGDCRALKPAAAKPTGREVKIITFVPEAAVDGVRNALATAGAGGLGNYRVCSFSTPGEGTFLPQDGSNPAIGQVGRLERVNERRLEMVCSRASLPLAIETLRQFHPYEEPAFDIVELVPEPQRRIGAGRRLVLDQPATVAELAERLKDHLGRARVRVGILGSDRPVSVVGVVAGAGEDMLDDAVREGCEVLVTGEMRHHSVLRALHAGVQVILAGHTNTERGYLPRLAARLGELTEGADLRVSQADRDVMQRV